MITLETHKARPLLDDGAFSLKPIIIMIHRNILVIFDYVEISMKLTLDFFLYWIQRSIKSSGKWLETRCMYVIKFLYANKMCDLLIFACFFFMSLPQKHFLKWWSSLILCHVLDVKSVVLFMITFSRALSLSFFFSPFSPQNADTSSIWARSRLCDHNVRFYRLRFFFFVHLSQSGTVSKQYCITNRFVDSIQLSTIAIYLNIKVYTFYFVDLRFRYQKARTFFFFFLKPPQCSPQNL